MIEFKADCGHTVRARDEDAGGVVRCSYCGRNAPVPDSLDSEIDFLFREVDDSGETDQKFTRKARRASKKKSKQKKRSGEGFDPFAVVLKLCYVAALVIIVVVISRKFVMPLFEDQGRSDRFAHTTPKDTKNQQSGNRRRKKNQGGPGLVSMPKPNGLFVSSTPPNASVYCIEQSKAPATGRIANTKGVKTFTTPGVCSRLPNGEYVVEVAFRWNDPRISDSKLSNYQNYLALRRAISTASDEQRRQLLDDYFVPDEATNVFVEETTDQKYLIRQYHGVTVRDGRSKGVRALFLPKLFKRDSSSFSIESLVTGYILNNKGYEFDESFVMNELAFYDVEQADRRFVIEALSRIGTIPYVTPDGDIRLFKIGIYDGEFASQIIRNASE